MRVFTFISKQGDSFPIAQRIKSEGHHVSFYINDKDARNIGEGLIDKSKEKGILISESGSIDKSVLKGVLHPRPDVVVMDMVGSGFGKLSEQLRKDGIPVIGGSQWGDLVELDRIYGDRVMKLQGIGTPMTYKFTDYKMAIDFVKKKKIAFVYKPSGNQHTYATYVAEGPLDMIGMLRYYSGIIPGVEFELQERVEGIEVSTELWFNGTDVIGVNHTMEEKKLMVGGIGPKAGCMGSVVWTGFTGSKLFKEGVGRLVPALKKVNYRGPVDLNTIVNSDRLYGLEFTARFGYDALFVLLEMYKGRINDLFYSVATGVAKEMKYKSDWGMGIDIAIPPYPLTCEPEMYKDIPVIGVNRFNEKHIWFYDVYKKGQDLLASGNGGDIGTVTARGDKVGDWSPIRDAKRRIMRTIDNLVIPDLMYRVDIGDRVQREHSQLVKWGWL